MKELKTLTVKELKEILNKFPDSMFVMFEGDENYFIQNKHTVEEFDCFDKKDQKVLCLHGI